MKKRYQEAQIIGFLKQADAGAKVGETCRKHGISDATYYHWKAKYAGMEVSQLCKLRDVEAENARLKKKYVELALLHHALQVQNRVRGLAPKWDPRHRECGAA